MPTSTSAPFSPGRAGQIIAPFRQLVARAAERATELSAVLDREAAALVRRDASLLAAAAEEKSRLVEALRELDEEQTRCLAQHGVSRRGAAVEAWLDRHGGPAVAAPWIRLVALLDLCRRKNQTNGATIELQRSHLDRVLAILHGVEEDRPLYGPLGEKRALNPSRYSATA